MGSFTELVAAVDFRDDVPPEVLAAFRPLRGGPRCRLAALPALPSLTEDETAELDELIEIAYVDEIDLTSVSARVLAHLWFAAFDGAWNGWFRGEPRSTLRRQRGHWTFTTRTYFKGSANPICDVLRPLARYTCPDAMEEQPVFVGYVRFEGDDRPVFIWHDGSDQLRFEDVRRRPSAG